ncbi:DUF6942 family protein [Marinomonas ostreistagni]|uniref:DUF6942 family protein n=1 Tax=Marinomonas ostreistagni TaxID=359209 RepID=UPI003AEF7AF3
MIFLLPNTPILPEHMDHYSNCSPKLLIDMNGNHWRKILTIIAKLLTAPGEDWRIVRDQYIWERARLCFSADELPLKGEYSVIVGKTFLEELPIPHDADQIVCGKHAVYISGSCIWSPYLDYRQFPNMLIEALKTRLKVSP